MSKVVFILKDQRENIQEILESLGYKGQVSKFTKETWDNRGENYDLRKLGDYFPSQDSHNWPWLDLYRTYLFHPKSTIPRDFIADGRKYTIYDDLFPSTPTELRKKVSLELFKRYIEEDLRVPEKLQDNIRSNYLLYLKDPIMNFCYLHPGVFMYQHQEEFIKWIEENIDLFPEYHLLLLMYNEKDVSEFYGTWMDFFEDDDIDPSEYLGNLCGLDYQTYTI